MTTLKVNYLVMIKFSNNTSKHQSLIFTVYDSNESLIVKACGKTNPVPITSSSSSLRIVFKTDGSRNATGFKSLWTTENVNSIKSLDYPQSNYPNNADQVNL